MLLFLKQITQFFCKSKSMIPDELFASISPYLICEDRWTIMKLRPSQRRTHDPEEIRDPEQQMWKLMVEFLSKFQVCGIRIDRVNLIRVAK